MGNLLKDYSKNQYLKPGTHVNKYLMVAIGILILCNIIQFITT